MKKPQYTEQFYAVVFLSLGGAFLVSGLLSFCGIVKPTASSMIQSNIVNGIVFCVLGIIFCIVKIIFTGLAFKKDRLNRELLSNGSKVTGIVEKVYMQKYMQYGQKSPYRVLYTYTYQDKTYHGKSYLLWDEPRVKEADVIEVFVNESGKSAIQL